MVEGWVTAMPNLRDFDARFHRLDWRPLAGGFSGALVFGTQRFILKGWPPGVPLQNVEYAHRHWRRVVDLPFVPQLFSDRYGRSVCESGGRFWDLSERKPGAPATSPSELENAAETIALLHRGWAATATRADALASRVAFVNAAVTRCHALNFDHLEPLERDLCNEAVRRLRTLDDATPIGFSQVVHGDLHRDHILHLNGGVSGFIDFASVKRDHPALDIARLFENQPADLLQRVVKAYQIAHECVAFDCKLVERMQMVLATGAVAHWLRRLAANEVAEDQRAAAMVRLRDAMRQLSISSTP